MMIDAPWYCPKCGAPTYIVPREKAWCQCTNTNCDWHEETTGMAMRHAEEDGKCPDYDGCDTGKRFVEMYEAAEMREVMG